MRAAAREEILAFELQLDMFDDVKKFLSQSLCCYIDCHPLQSAQQTVSSESMCVTAGCGCVPVCTVVHGNKCDEAMPDADKLKAMPGRCGSVYI